MIFVCFNYRIGDLLFPGAWTPSNFSQSFGYEFENRRDRPLETLHRFGDSPQVCPSCIGDGEIPPGAPLILRFFFSAKKGCPSPPVGPRLDGS